MGNISGTSWTYNYEDQKKKLDEQENKPLAEQLEDAAKTERLAAKQYEGCTFLGEWPGSFHLRQAMTLERAAVRIRELEKDGTDDNKT